MKKKLYEGMFLVDSGEAGSDWDGVIAAIRKVLERAKVEIVSIRKWDDRRLAYEIKRTARGTYILCYFRADGQRNHEIEKAVQLSEKIMRVLILSVDQMTEEDIEKDTPATKVEREKEKRKAAHEAAQEAEAAKQEDKIAEETEPAQEPEIAEEADRTQGAEIAEEAQQAQEAEITDEARMTEEPEPAKEDAEDSPESQPKVAEDD
jgi:small subunit ribosomal protein S6